MRRFFKPSDPDVTDVVVTDIPAIVKIGYEKKYGLKRITFEIYRQDVTYDIRKWWGGVKTYQSVFHGAKILCEFTDKSTLYLHRRYIADTQTKTIALAETDIFQILDFYYFVLKQRYG